MSSDELTEGERAVLMTPAERIIAPKATEDAEELVSKGLLRRAVFPSLFGDLVSGYVRTAEGKSLWRHDVEWRGVYRGPDECPRECGYCNTCEREVYDGEGGCHWRGTQEADGG